MLRVRVRDVAAAATDAGEDRARSGLPRCRSPLPRAQRAMLPRAPWRDRPALCLYAEAIALATGADRRNFEFHARAPSTPIGSKGNRDGASRRCAASSRNAASPVYGLPAAAVGPLSRRSFARPGAGIEATTCAS